MNKPATKLPMVLWEAKPKAAPPIADAERIHSGCRPPTRAIAAMASSRITMRNVSMRLLVVCGSSLTLLANRDKYLENNLSAATATVTMIRTEIMS